MANDSEFAVAYKRGSEPSFVFLSPLAAGADQIAAEIALEAGYLLHVIAPFPRAEYERDFHDETALARFRFLMSRADQRILELDGSRGDYESASYEAAGRLVVRNCDLLIAVWDGQSSRGRGGTEEVVRYSTNVGVPVWWIHSEDACDPRWVTGTLDITRSAAISSAELALHEYLRRLLLPPRPADLHARSLLEHVMRIGQKLRPHPLQVYLTSRPRRRWAFWRLHGFIIRLAAGRLSEHLPRASPSSGYWPDHFWPADRRANDFAMRFRSGYVWLYLLTIVSVGLAALTPVLPHSNPIEIPSTLVELLALLVVSGLVLNRQWNEWQQRWRDYRRLAELFRAQQVLAPLAEALHGWIKQVSGMEPSPLIGRSLWVMWLFSAATRSAPLKSGCFDASLLRHSRDSVRDLVRMQRTYHSTASVDAARAESAFRRIDEYSFPLVMLLVAVKLVVILRHWEQPPVEWLSLGATILPVIAANVASLRAAARLQVQADRSRTMADEMRRAEARLADVDLSRPLASQDLSAIAHDTAAVMLLDTDGRLAFSDGD